MTTTKRTTNGQHSTAFPRIFHVPLTAVPEERERYTANRGSWMTNRAENADEHEKDTTTTSTMATHEEDSSTTKDIK